MIIIPSTQEPSPVGATNVGPVENSFCSKVQLDFSKCKASRVVNSDRPWKPSERWLSARQSSTAQPKICLWRSGWSDWGSVRKARAMLRVPVLDQYRSYMRRGQLSGSSEQEDPGAHTTSPTTPIVALTRRAWDDGSIYLDARCIQYQSNIPWMFHDIMILALKFGQKDIMGFKTTSFIR